MELFNSKNENHAESEKTKDCNELEQSDTVEIVRQLATMFIAGEFNGVPDLQGKYDVDDKTFSALKTSAAVSAMVTVWANAEHEGVAESSEVFLANREIFEDILNFLSDKEGLTVVTLLGRVAGERFKKKEK